MIVQFVIAALLLLVLFSMVIVIHFRRSKSNQSLDQERRNQLNHELYDIRLQEVESDTQQGVVVDKENVIAELQYNLLDDIDEKPNQKNNNAQKIWIPGIVFLILASVALYSTVGAFKAVDNWDNALTRYPEIYQKLFQDNNSQPNEQELQDLMIGLRTHLVNHPDDAKGWVLYSRLGRIFKDQELAMGAIEKAVNAAPDDIEMKLEYIELKMKIGDEYQQATAEIMLKRLLQQHPDNYDAWSMYGFMALQKQDFASAIQRWQKMLVLVGENSEKASMLKGSIAYAEKQLALQGQANTASAQPIVENNSVKPTPEVIGASYQVTVTLAEQATYAQGSTLFIYAQSVNGPAMPIAAIKLPITEFPVKVVLSDANAMVKNIKLSDYPEFVIKARISADGTVNKSNGQWSGQSGVIKAGQQSPINIEINQQS